MAVTISALHALRLVNQVQQNLLGLQLDIARNAETWKTMAQAQSPPLATLQQFITDAITQYQTRLGWITTFQAGVNNQKLIDGLAKINLTPSDIADLYTPLKNGVDQMAAANRNTYNQIVNFCNGILAAVDKPLSLWPE